MKYTCKKFCLNYMLEQDKNFKIMNKNFHLPYKKRTKKQLLFDFNLCKKVFCNPDCEGYNYRNKRFYKPKNGFKKSYKINALKKKGSLSGCIKYKIDLSLFIFIHKKCLRLIC